MIVDEKSIETTLKELRHKLENKFNYESVSNNDLIEIVSILQNIFYYYLYENE